MQQQLQVLVANIGNKDTDPFDLGLKFIYEDGSGVDGRWMVDPLAGLKAGEQRWLAYRPMCCGFVPTEFVVKSTVRFQVIADPTYYKAYGPYDPRMYEVKSKIIESNKKNNTLTLNKSEMRRCDLKNVEREPPRIQVKPPVRP